MTSQRIHVTKLSHVHYQHPNLEKASRFFEDFGFVQAGCSGNRVYLRGYGVQPLTTIAEQSPDGNRHFIGGYWVVESIEELQKAANHATASKITDLDAPGGGKVVTLRDPNGFGIGFVFGQKLRDGIEDTEVQQLERATVVANNAAKKFRYGEFRRFKQGPSPIHKLGHYGFMVPPNKYKETLQFYTETLNLKPTDIVYSPVTGEDDTCFCHIDLGAEYTDHHSLFVAAGPEGTRPYVHHSSYEVNDFDTQTLGHDFLRGKGWTNCWGIGRHVLGSQIFDYW
ncbi:Glyoxalase/Bleomycin resistance protein/Dihydroxybiphenyl dioxygenase [Halenospora varia]|nr:Glyoxalase/Bleomycin resistance protein/Dihydroxybiphenyl dioxygenase [Halenospora varia]